MMYFISSRVLYNIGADSKYSLLSYLSFTLPLIYRNEYNIYQTSNSSENNNNKKNKEPRVSTDIFL